MANARYFFAGAAAAATMGAVALSSFAHGTTPLVGEDTSNSSGTRTCESLQNPNIVTVARRALAEAGVKSAGQVAETVRCKRNGGAVVLKASTFKAGL